MIGVKVSYDFPMFGKFNNLIIIERTTFGKKIGKRFKISSNDIHIKLHSFPIIVDTILFEFVSHKSNICNEGDSIATVPNYRTGWMW